MPVKRDADGNILEEPTNFKAQPDDDDPTDYKPGRQPPPQSGNADTGVGDSDSSYDAKTVLANTLKKKDRKQQSQRPAEDARTRVYRPRAPATATDASPASAAPVVATTTPSTMEDPPVGWLAVVAGPGQGHVVTLGNGANTIGRDASQRLSLDLGDETISRTNHAIITYDPRGKKFYIQHGGGTNLTYVNNEPVLTPVELQPHTHILIGNTTLRFVPLCGETFDWDTPQGE